MLGSLLYIWHSMPRVLLHSTNVLNPTVRVKHINTLAPMFSSPDDCWTAKFKYRLPFTLSDSL